MSHRIVKSLLVITLAAILLAQFQKWNSSKVGISAINLLYKFHDYTELDSNMAELRKIVTSSVYDELTIDNEGRLLNTYLKFKGNACIPHVIASTSDYVLYTLETQSIEETRLFLFIYSTNLFGKIDSVREVECIDFVYHNS